MNVGKIEVARDKWKLWLCVGLPYSGKTTWAKQQGFPIVSPDAIRVAIHGQRFVLAAEPFVWATAYAMAEALFLAGHQEVVIDATNVTNARRMEWLRRFPNTSFQIFDTSPEECSQRALAAGDTEIVPVIEQMAAGWDLPVPVGWKRP